MATYMTSQKTADYIRLSESTLRKMRLRGDGPPYSKLGVTVVYTREKVDAWVAANERRSTSEEVE